MIVQEIIVGRKQEEATAQSPHTERIAAPPAQPLSLEYTMAVERHEKKVEEMIKKSYDIT